MTSSRVRSLPATSTRLMRTRGPLATETRSTTSPAAAPCSSRTETSASGNPAAAKASSTPVARASLRRAK